MAIMGPNGQQMDPAAMNSEMMGTMPPDAFAGATAADMASMPPHAMGCMNADMMGNMPPPAMGGMGPDHMASMPPPATSLLPVLTGARNLRGSLAAFAHEITPTGTQYALFQSVGLFTM